jgi:glycogen debranching enzyme
LKWLQTLYEEKLYTYDGVKVIKDDKFYDWNAWSQLLNANFESWFYIPLKSKHDSYYFIEPNLVGVHDIYKDTVGSYSEFGIYQFRPNQLIVMTVTPELFDRVHAVR